MTLNKTQKIFTLIGFLIFLAFIVGVILIFNNLYNKEKLNNKSEEVSVNSLDNLNKVLVESVTDGDTIKVKIGDTTEKVRLIGIDTPELKPLECYGKEAKEYLTSLIQGKYIFLEDDKSQSDRDKYNRLLRYIYLESDMNHSINEQLIEDGFAKEYTYSKAYKYQKDFIDSEEYAEENNIGMWGSCTN